MNNKVTNFKLLTTLFGIVLISSMILIPSYVYAGEATLNSIEDKLDDIDTKVQELLDGSDGFYSISITGIKLESGAVGIFVDCTELSEGTDCVFTVDSIRYDQKEFTKRSVPTGPKGSQTELRTVPGKVLGVCIDFVNSESGTPISNCSPTIIETGGIGTAFGFGVSFEPSIGVGTGVEGELGISGGPGWSWGTSIPIRDPLPIPLPNQFNIGDKQVGGNILIDSGLGGILATKFVIIKHQDFIGDINIIGTKNANMKLVIGTESNDVVTCTQGGMTITDTCDDEFKNALTTTAKIAEVENVDFEQENAFGVTNVGQNNVGQAPQIQTVGLTNDLPSIGLGQLLDGHADDIQALTDLRNDQLTDLIDLEEIVPLLEKMFDKGLAKKIEDLAVENAKRLPPLFDKLIAELDGAVDLTGVIMEIKDTVDDVEGKVNTVQSDITGIPTKVTTEVDRIIKEIQDLFK